MPRSAWLRQSEEGIRQIAVTGLGARVNIGSTDQSSQYFQQHSAEMSGVHEQLQDIRSAIQQLEAEDARRDSTIDVGQLQLELQRTRPDKARVWSVLERLNTVSGLGEKVARWMAQLDGML